MNAAAPESLIAIVGLGASAGGLEALQSFFEAMPPNRGVGFVVVTHQHPAHTSLLPELLARYTQMPVHVVNANMRVEPDTVYVAPPGIELLIEGRTLRPQASPHDHLHLPINRFFRSLAEDQRERAVGIVLSGMGTDGSVGIEAIKAAEGMVMAQQPESAGHSGMPSSAIATGLVDYVLPPTQMPMQLLAYLEGGYSTSDAIATVEQPIGEIGEIGGIDQIFSQLLGSMGYDFSGYKRTTIERRIERRMTVQQITGLREYAQMLRENPHEVRALFKELLIGVTSFFRDREAFVALELLLREHLPHDRPLRVWVPGCSTGEEAYSVAMVLSECIDGLSEHPGFQVFATDLDPSAIEVARSGTYPEGIADDVSPERLERFFVHDEDRFRVKKELRDHLVFAEQNVIADPPFTKLDLLCCRNLLIYLDTELQRRLLPMFHYALNPGGLLFLGSSESLGPSAELFGVLDKTWRIFRRQEVAAGTYVAPLNAGRFDRLERIQRGAAASGKPSRELLDTIHRVLLDHLAAPSVLVHESGQFVHIHGHTGEFLEPAPGLQSAPLIFDMAREGLRLSLGAAMRLACRQPGPVVQHGVRVRSNNGWTLVDLRVEQLAQPELLRGLLLVSFLNARPLSESASPSPGMSGMSGMPGMDVSGRVGDLERELSYAKQTNQSTIDELDTSNEELKSTNEELQSANEELQSANEELETSKEELQSLNEELQTVNVELQSKVEELSRFTDDMHNLLNGTDIATIFLDDRLCIKRYTDQAKDVIRLIPSDVGRPIGDLVSKLRYDRLADDAKEVLRTLVFKQAEIRGEGDTWYLMRILPYRTAHNVIDGLVVTFVNITEVKGLQTFEKRMYRALAGMDTYVYGLDTQLRVTWSSGPVFGHPVELARGKPLAELLPAQEAERLLAVQRQVLEAGKPLQTQLQLGGGSQPMLGLYVDPVHDDEGRVIGLTCVSANRRSDVAP